MSNVPSNLKANPRLGLWVEVEPEGTILVRTGKVELGQGLVTAMAAIAAAELGVGVERLRMMAGDTAATPDEGYTAGSLSIEHGGVAMRHATALVRSLFAEAAAAAFGIPVTEIDLEDGVFRRRGGNESASYWDLRDRVDLDRLATDLPDPEFRAPPVGDAFLPRRDLPAKLSGAAFVHDTELPNLAYGRVLRPPHPKARLAAFDRSEIARLDGIVVVVVDGSFVGIAAERDDIAAKAVERAGKIARWEIAEELPPFSADNAWMEEVDPAASTVLMDETAGGSGSAGFDLEAVFARPYIAHASIGPACAVASWQGGALEVWTHSQGVFPLRVDLARVFSIPTESITVHHVQGAGCYGHNGADDVALDAALIAREAGRPVICQWSRADELGWSPFGAAMRSRLAARLSPEGRISEWHYEVWSPPHVVRPGGQQGVNLLAARHLSEPLEATPVRDVPQPSGSGDRNAVPIYDLGARRITHHRLPQGPVRSSALRSLGAHLNVFAIESAMDELAAQAGRDPLAFRLAHLSDPRARAVLEAAARLAGWERRGTGGEGEGMGLGLARYKSTGAWCAVVSEVAVEEKVRLRNLWAVADCGRVVHRDGVVNQVEGGMVQAASWTLKEAVRWTEEGVITRSWDAYPILGFSEVPPIHVDIIDRPDQPPLGAGECAAGPTAAAIGNAVAHALGVRVCTMPLTAEQIEAAIIAAG